MKVTIQPSCLYCARPYIAGELCEAKAMKESHTEWGILRGRGVAKPANQ